MSNVVLFISDEHNPFVASVYGHTRVSTPNMDQLAAAGIVFENAYCPSPLCLPARSAFLTGRRVHQLQTYNNCTLKLKTDIPSLGQLLAKNDIHTVYVGKVDAYAKSDKLGFSRMILPGDRGDPGDTHFRRTPLAIRNEAATRREGFGPREDPYAGDDNIVDMALNWLREDAPNLERPWLLIVAINAPHFPHFTTPELWEMYSTAGDLPQFGPNCESANHPFALDLRAHFQTDLFTQRQIRGLRRGYLGCVTYVDRQLGRLAQTIEQAGLSTSTNLVYTSDHGDMLGKFGLWWKCSLYEDSVRVPLIVAGPDFSPGVRIKTPVDLLDLNASIFSVFGVKRPEELCGEPLQEISVTDEDRVVFSEYHGHGTHSGAFMVRKGNWKLIWYDDAPHQLFDLAHDPNELRNLYESEPTKAAELEKDLRRICSPEDENQRAHEFESRQIRALNDILNS
jgi:choline-sulfatase